MDKKHLPDYCYSGRPMSGPDGVVVHYFSGKNVEPENRFDMDVCYRLFLDLNRAKAERKFYLNEDHWPDGRMYASAHILIGRDGTTWELIDPTLQAWHAGKSLLNDRDNCNAWTLGIELVGDQHSGFTRVQYTTLADLLAPMIDAGMNRQNIAGHDTVRFNAIQAGQRVTKYKYDPSGRKDGTGNNFDWWYLFKFVNDKTDRPPTDDGLPDDRVGLSTRYNPPGGPSHSKPI